ncbi:unnamed protein product [Clavelina lepadiformis]|uniref:Kinesin-like protein n=1 Tax=Clavelina lepadiformis TaxID=159417 RepID=A0ABP0GAJ2_CLALP
MLISLHSDLVDPNSGKNMSKINVYLRFRPVFHKPDEEPEDSCIRSADNSTIEMINLRNTQETVSYKFQQVFGENSSQEEVFGTALQPLLSHFTDDVQNVSVFAYGPTGSGKTFTILGSDETPGFIPRTLRHLFARTRKNCSSSNITATFSMSYIEIYQENVHDLLDDRKKLFSLRQDNCGNILIPGITEIKVENFNDFEKYFVPASHQRRMAKTSLNERSSRSHTILIVKLTTQERKAPFLRKTAKLSIVDLAGSEDNRQTGNRGLRLKESSAINTSLHVLGKVVVALNKNNQHRVPYRDSKLTRLLQDSLGGSSHTCMVVNLSPEMSSIFDTQRALNFATKSMTIINRPFTRVEVAEFTPSNEKDETETVNRKHKSTAPILSPSMLEEAKKLKLPVERFVDIENVKPEDAAIKAHKQVPQKVLIESIRNSANIFKGLEQTPKKITSNDISVNDDISVPPKMTPSKQSQVFTVQHNNKQFTFKFKT